MAEESEKQTPPISEKISRRESFRRMSGGLAAVAGLTGREVLRFEGRGFGSLVAARIGIPFLSKEIKQEELEERKSLIEGLDKVETKEELEKVLTELTNDFIREYDYHQAFGNDQIARVSPQNPDPQRESIVNNEREQVNFLVQRGVALLSGWKLLRGGEQPQFDRNLRLHLEGKRLSINENITDFHIALNLIRAKLALSVEKDSLKKELLEEDWEDLMKLVDLRPEIQIGPEAWIIMPREWAINLARVYLIIKRNNLPPPTKFLIDPKELSTTPRQGYYETAHARFPAKGQIVALGPTHAPQKIFHEMAHYIADTANIKRRVVGPREVQFPDLQLAFDSVVGKIQESLLHSARKAGEKKLPGGIEWFVTDYALTNTKEDFAETFQEFCTRGPAFKRRFEQMRVWNPAAAALLEAKQEFMRTELLGGEELSFEARRKRSEIARWEDQFVRLASLPVSPVESAAWGAKWRTEFVRTDPRFKWNAEVFAVIPEEDVNYALFLLQPSIWEDFLGPNGRGIKAISAIFPIPHYELRGAFTVKVKTVSGEKAVNINTHDPSSIQKFFELLPQLEFPSPQPLKTIINYSNKTVSLLEELDLTPFDFNPWIWNKSFPVTFIDNPSKFFVRFQYDEKINQWRNVPIDVRSITIHQTFVDQGGREQITSNYFYPVRVGKRDILLVIDDSGRLEKIHT